MSLFNSYNRVVLLGNITRDIELRTLSTGTRVADIGLAVNERIKKGDQWVDDTTFVDITVWGKTAEFLERFGSKGKPVLIEGRLRLDRWVDKTSGQNRTKLKVVAESITFVDGGKGEGGRGGRPQSSQSGSQDAPPTDDMPYAQSMSGDDEVPF